MSNTKLRRRAMLASHARGGDPNDVVDFGLSVKWLKYNLAGDRLADDESDYGYYYQWASTTGYPDASTHTFDLSTVPYIQSASKGTYTTKYYNDEDTLEPMDDAVTALLGSEYRMPTVREYLELYGHCGGKSTVTSTTISPGGKYVGSLSGTTSVSSKGVYFVAAGTTVDGVKYTNQGCLFIGQDITKRVFFPASGYCYDSSVGGVGSTGLYWSSSLYTNGSGGGKSGYIFYCGSSSVYPASNHARSGGLAIRPVKVV